MDLTQIITLQRVSKTYSKNIIALKEISTTIFKKDVIGIIGENGSGKSTLLKIIAGKLKPTSGLTSIIQLDVQQQLEQLKSKISYIGQDKSLDPEMSGNELLMYFSALYNLTKKEALFRVSELINTFEMSEFINRRVRSYSGGQAQRLHIAIGIIHKPQVLLLDEPTNGLDPCGKKFLWQFIQSYQKQGNTILIASHELEAVSKNCSRIIMLEKGSLLVDGTIDEVIQSYAKPILCIKLTESFKVKDELAQQLNQLFKLADIQFKNNTVKLIFSTLGMPDKSSVILEIIQFFAKQKLSVEECQWEDAGVANVYFGLTGKKINQPSYAEKKIKRKRRIQ